VAFWGCPPLINRGTKNSGMGMTFAVLIMQSPSGTGRTVVQVVSVFMMVQSSGQNQAWVSAKSCGVSFRIFGSSESGLAWLTKARVCPLFGCFTPNAMPRHLMP